MRGNMHEGSVFIPKVFDCRTRCTASRELLVWARTCRPVPDTFGYRIHCCHDPILPQCISVVELVNHEFPERPEAAKQADSAGQMWLLSAMRSNYCKELMAGVEGPQIETLPFDQAPKTSSKLRPGRFISSVS